MESLVAPGVAGEKTLCEVAAGVFVITSTAVDSDGVAPVVVAATVLVEMAAPVVEIVLGESVMLATVVVGDTVDVVALVDFSIVEEALRVWVAVSPRIVVAPLPVVSRAISSLEVNMAREVVTSTLPIPSTAGVVEASRLVICPAVDFTASVFVAIAGKVELVS